MEVLIEKQPTVSTMTAPVRLYRYQLPRKAIKSDCPDCSPKHRKTLSRYVDTQTGEPLPPHYGRCDRESNCGYHLSPYEKARSGVSYADAAYEQRKAIYHPTPIQPQVAARQSNKRTTDAKNRLETRFSASVPATRVGSSSPSSAVPLIHYIPNEVTRPSIGHYERNEFARLLRQQFGLSKATDLLARFQIGTSAHWPGACVFWLIDEQNRIRGGQVKLFADNWHTAKYIDREGRTRSHTSWVHYALQRRLEREAKPLPDWLIDYSKYADKSPCLFGLTQLITAPADAPIAIVEAPKTAVICSAYLPGFVWLAVMGKSYLKPERLAALHGRRIVLYPDLNACYNTTNNKGHTVKGWLMIADELRAVGFTIEVSEWLEQHATDEQRNAGLDLADFLLQQPPTVSTVNEQLAAPGSLLRPDATQLTRLPTDGGSDYPVEWDAPSPPYAKPTIQQRTFHEWQQQYTDFTRLDLPSLI